MAGPLCEKLDQLDRAGSHQPLLQVLVAAAIGIAVDRNSQVPFLVFFVLLPVSSISWAIAWVRNRLALASLLMLLLVAAVAGAWHHLHWHTISPWDISSFARSAPRPAVIRGTVVQQPNWVFESAAETRFSRPRGTRSRTVLRVHGIRNGQVFEPAFGRVAVFVNGQVSGLVAGDNVIVFGHLKRIDRPSNPGQFDFRQFARGQGIHCWMTVDHPDCLQPDAATCSPLSTFIGRLRNSLDRQIWNHIDAEHAPLASAMLLGNRQQLNQIQQNRFLVSGTIHLLAISGLHVGILASLFLLLPRLNLATRRGSLALTAAFVWSYAWIVEFRPPVVRAAILISLICFCKWAGRKPFSLNSLALAGIIVLVINPADLFNSGAQLSFLAVATLMLAQRWLVAKPPTDPIDRLIAATQSWKSRLIKRCLFSLRTAALASGIIWLLALPLVAIRFHIVAPIALVANPLLLLPITAGLFCGFGVLVFGWLIPPLGALCGKGCGLSLWLIDATVRMCEQIPLGHFWVSGPPPMAVGILYTAVFLFVFCRPIQETPAWLLLGLLGWIVVGWIAPHQMARWESGGRPELKVTVIDVGHGNCVLLQLPQGKTVLYDCGSFGSATFGQRSAAGVLWHEGITRIDTVVISHADSDHFNGLPELARRISIGRIVISQAMAQHAGQGLLRQLMDVFATNGIPVEIVSTGNQIVRDNAVDIRVLNPPQGGFQEGDNADSIVLDIQMRGFHLLLPGDVEGQGLKSLLAHSPLPYDVVMAPHHGSLNSLPRQFVAWAQPQYVLISNDDENIKQNYRLAISPLAPRILQTGLDGAIQIRVGEDGSFEIRNWIHSPW